MWLFEIVGYVLLKVFVEMRLVEGIFVMVGIIDVVVEVFSVGV